MAVGILPSTFPDFLPYPTGWLLERGDDRYRQALLPYMDCLWTRGDGALPPLLPGDLMLFRVGRADAHSAIVTTWPLVIHAQDDVGGDGCVCEASAIANALSARPLASAWRAKALR